MGKKGILDRSGSRSKRLGQIKVLCVQEGGDQERKTNTVEPEGNEGVYGTTPLFFREGNCGVGELIGTQKILVQIVLPLKAARINLFLR
jgi:hypothetical protein